MRDKDGYLVENPIKRYAVGERSKFMYDAGGSMTIYIQREAPEKGGQLAPVNACGASKLYVSLRPEQKDLAGNWAPPAVQKAT
jgi:hypothetical protein